MRDALDLLNIPYPLGKSSFNLECPSCFHQHKNKRKTLHIDFNIGDHGVFCCPRCDVKGGVVSFWALIKGLDSNKAAASDIQRCLEGTEAKKVISNNKNAIIKPVSLPICELTERNKTYRALIDLLTLDQTHKKNLLERGLKEPAIETYQYRSLPLANRQGVANRLLEQGCLLEGVPGFYKKNGNWEVIPGFPGFLIPLQDGYGQIQGFQIRLEKALPDGTRYLTFSGKESEFGTKSGAFCHLRKGFDFEEIILTEGALKADIIHFFSGYTVLAIPGVNALSYLTEALLDLKAYGTKKILIAFDMDMYQNKHVQNSLIVLKNLLRDFNFMFSTLIWDPAQKGLDDYLYALLKKVA